MRLKDKQIMIIVDSSILCKRPRILEEMKANIRINYICITETVLKEMNYQKDKGKMHQQAWLAMTSFENNRKANKDRFLVISESNESGKKLNDEKIINASIRQAIDNPLLSVYLISNDIFFPLKADSLSNFKVLTLEDYEKEFIFSDEICDIKASSEFYLAINSKNIELAKKIKTKNININKIDTESGLTPLICAIRNKDKNMVDFLLSLSEIDINKCDEKKYKIPPICHAIQINDIYFVKILLKNGADIDRGSQGKNWGNTALMMAAWHGRIDMVKCLVEHGACCNQQDSNGFTPLIKACIHNHIEVARYLFDKTDKNIRCRNYKTAFDYAIRTRNKNMLEIFTIK